MSENAFATPDAIVRIHVLDRATGHDADPLLGGIDAEKPAGAPIFGDRVVRHQRVVGPPDPTAPPGVERGAFSKHQTAHRGMDAVGADDKVVAARLAIARARNQLRPLLLDCLDAHSHARRQGAGCRREQLEQFATAELPDRTEPLANDAEVIAVDHVALPVGNSVVIHRLACRDEVAEGAKAVQDAAAEGIETEHIAGVLEIRGAVDQVGFHIPAAQQRRQGQAADSCADDENTHVIFLIS